MKKCDVIIPVYNAAQWVNLCVYALYRNTGKENLGKVILVDDCSDENTKDLLKNLKKKYSNLEVITNKTNLGFVKNCNNGFKQCTSDYILLLNTDCIVSKGTIEKMMSHIEKNEKIGLICPISSNAANLTLEMFEGFSYLQMNQLLENKFKGMDFDACTVVGNCLMISKKCYDIIGGLDEAYGTGYGEETDYQFKAMKAGFEAKVAIDTYVFHKSEVSFGTSEAKQERLQKNRELFFSRWQNEYDELLEKYNENDPIKYILEHITEDDKKINVDTLYYLPDLVQNAGGVHVVVDMVNHLVINGLPSNILYNNIANYKEIMLFSPIPFKKIEKVKLSRIVSTIYTSTYYAKQIALQKNVPLISFVQGNELLFENGAVYGITELTYKISDYLMTISKYLQNELSVTFNKKAKYIANGINYNLLNTKRTNKKVRSIAMILRNSVMKGDWLLTDIIKKLSKSLDEKIELNIIYVNRYLEFPSFANSKVKINKYLGPLNREQIAKILKKSDIFIDASLNEGFGLMPLEAMACGCVPVVSNSLGNGEYMKDGKNGFVIKEVNVAEKYIEKINSLLNDDALFLKLRENAQTTASNFDEEKTFEEYFKYFSKTNFKITTENQTFTKEEKIIYDVITKRIKSEGQVRSKAFYIAKVIPRPIKERMKRVITAMYNTYQH